MTSVPSRLTACTLPRAYSGWPAIAFISGSWVAKSSASILLRADSYGPALSIAAAMPVSCSVTEVLVITEMRQNFDPVLGWADDALVRVGGRVFGRARERTLDVVDAADRARVAARLPGRAIDGEVSLSCFAGRFVGHQRADPAVCHPPGERECARFVGSDPDLDGVRRCRPGVDALE